jgi:thiol-disulfide isomerase/thioredoxin
MYCLHPPMRCICLAIFATLVSSAAMAATVEEALKYVPVQREVEYDRPAAQDIKQCTISPEKVGKVSAWIVRGPGGQVLRSFSDTDGDNNVDQWSYFQNGIETYRDIDSNFDGKADQYRWFGLAGTRWGIDKNQDGRIDYWKAISAEEVTSEVLGAIANQDTERFVRVLITPEELSRLGLGGNAEKRVERQILTANKRFTSLVGKQRDIDQRTKWVHFGATRPGVLPAGTDGATRDIMVYEIVSAVTENAGKHGQVAIGTLVRIGDVWRVLDIPTVLMEEKQSLAAAYFFQPTLNRTPEPPTAPEGAISEEMQALVDRLDKLDKQLAVATTPESRGKIYDQEGAVLRQMASQAKSQDEQTIWIRQLADTLSAGAQSGDYAKGVAKLAELYEELAKQSETAALTGYVKFRLMNAQYSMALQDPEAEDDFAAIQEQRVADLKDFVEQHPKSDDTPEAMLQVAIVEEFAGNEKEAVEWYDEILKSNADGLVARKAQGALRRLKGVGKPLSLEGQTTNGKKFSLSQLRDRIVVLHYWATWSEPSKDDLKKLDKLMAEYGGKFLPVGINVDTDDASMREFLRGNRLNWPQLHEEGGLDSRLAVDLGILTVPTMILVDEKGDVVDRNIMIGEVETYLSKNIE